MERSRTAGLYALDTGQEKITRISEYRTEHVQEKSRIWLISDIQLPGLLPGKDATDILFRDLLRNTFFTPIICYLATGKDLAAADI